jgi:hypothetical protein
MERMGKVQTRVALARPCHLPRQRYATQFSPPSSNHGPKTLASMTISRQNMAGREAIRLTGVRIAQT